MIENLPSPLNIVAERDRVPLILIMLLAVFLRFWQLGDLPPGLYHDEAYNGLDALGLVGGAEFPEYHEGWELYAGDAHADRPAQPTRTPVFFEGNYGREALHIYGMSAAISIFGATPFAIRFVPAVAGVFAVFTTYLAAAALFGTERRETVQTARPRTAEPVVASIPLLAALVLAVLYPALTFSRFGVRAMLFVPVETLAVFAFWSGVHAFDRVADRRIAPVPVTWHWFAAAGFFIGLGLSTYAAARVLPLLFLLFIPVWYWRSRPAWRYLIPQLALFLIFGLLAAAPLLLFFAEYPYFLVFRTLFVANKGLGVVEGQPWLTWLNNLGRVAQGLVYRGELNIRHNLPGRPYLDAIQAVFFVGGLVHLLRPPRLRHLFLVLWLAVMLLPTIMSGDAPHFGRMIGAAPVIAILVALGANVFWQRLASWRWLAGEPYLVPKARAHRNRRRARPWLPVILVWGLLFFSTGWAYYDYFVRYAQHEELAAAFYLDDWQIGQFAAAQPAGTTLYLTPAQEHMATFYFALGGEATALTSYGDGALPLGVPAARAVYLMPVAAAASLEKLQDTFPTGSAELVTDAFIAFTAPAEANRLLTSQLSDQDLGANIGLVGWEDSREATALSVTLLWQANGPLAADYTAFVHVVDGDGAIAAQLDRQPAGYPTGEWRTGELVIDTFVITLPPDLPADGLMILTGFYDAADLTRTGEPVRLGPLPDVPGTP